MAVNGQSVKAFSITCTNESQERSTSRCSHLRPLSSYSRKIMYDNMGDWPGQFGANLMAPLCNIKINIINNGATISTKRQLDDSAQDEGYSTPLRKRFALASSTPDLGSELGVCGAPKPPAEPPKLRQLTILRKGESNGAAVPLMRAPAPKPAPVSNRVAVIPPCGKGESKFGSGGVLMQTREPPPCPEKPAPPQDQCFSPKTPVDFNISHAFDFDIDDILSLSPIDSDGEGSDGIEAFIESCHSFYEENARSPMGDAQVRSDPHQGVGKGVGAGQEDGGETQKEAVSLDEGYFSRSYREALRKGSDCGPLGPASTSTPVVLGRESSTTWQQVYAKGEAPGSPAPVNEPVVRRNLLSCLEDTPLSLAPLGRRPPLGPEVGEVGWAEEVKAVVHWRSLTTESHTPDGLGVEVRVAGGESWLAPVTEHLEDISETSYNTTILSPVQVRSVVVVPPKRLELCDARTQSGITCFNRESDWQREKRRYVDAVTNHMADSPPPAGGVMTELLNLMNTVATQGATNGNKPWQHPSDFTRRNHQGRGDKPRLSLDDWRDQNGWTFCRFANMPLKFQRSPIP